ncbi:MAG: glycosyltransferase family 39 protein [Thermoanaerobaculia bacterium]
MTREQPALPEARRGSALLFALALALVGAGVFFRLAGLLRAPLWLDEAYSAYAVSKGFDFIWNVVPRYDTHPPLYYSLLRSWSLAFGDSLAGLRALGIAGGLATLAVSFQAGRELGRSAGIGARSVGSVAAALAAISPLMIDMSREARPYSLMILAYAIALSSIIRLSCTMQESGTIARGAFVVYLIALGTLLWLHNLGPLFGAALFVALVAALSGSAPGKFDRTLLIGGHAIVALAYLPALRILLDQAPTWVQSTWLTFSWQGIHWKLAALWGAPGIIAASAAGLLATLGAMTLIRNGQARIAVALGLAAIVPPAASLLASVTLAPVFLIRTLSPVGIPAALIVAVGVVSQTSWRRWLAGAAAALLIAQLAIIDLGSRKRGPREDWYGAVRWLEQRYRPGDLVLAYPNEGALPFERALRDLGVEMPTRPIPSAVPTFNQGGWNPTGSRGVVSLPPDRLSAIAGEPELARVSTVWLLRLGPWDHDKGDVFLGELSRRRVSVGRWQSGPIDLVGLSRPDDPRVRATPPATR